MRATLRQLEEGRINAEPRLERRGVQVGATRHGQTSTKDSRECGTTHSGVHKRSACVEREGRGHTETPHAAAAPMMARA